MPKGAGILSQCAISFYIYQNSLAAVGQYESLGLLSLAAECGNRFSGAVEFFGAFCAFHRAKSSADFNKRQAVFAQHVHRRNRARNRKIEALAQLPLPRLFGASMDYVRGKPEFFNALRDERQLLPVESSMVSLISGRAISRGIPGNPPPVPTSMTFVPG